MAHEVGPFYSLLLSFYARGAIRSALWFWRFNHTGSEVDDYKEELEHRSLYLRSHPYFVMQLRYRSYLKVRITWDRVTPATIGQDNFDVEVRSNGWPYLHFNKPTNCRCGGYAFRPIIVKSEYSYEYLKVHCPSCYHKLGKVEFMGLDGDTFGPIIGHPEAEDFQEHDYQEATIRNNQFFGTRLRDIIELIPRDVIDRQRARVIDTFAGVDAIEGTYRYFLMDSKLPRPGPYMAGLAAAYLRECVDNEVLLKSRETQQPLHLTPEKYVTPRLLVLTMLSIIWMERYGDPKSLEIFDTTIRRIFWRGNGRALSKEPPMIGDLLADKFGKTAYRIIFIASCQEGTDMDVEARGIRSSMFIPEQPIEYIRMDLKIGSVE